MLQNILVLRYSKSHVEGLTIIMSRTTVADFVPVPFILFLFFKDIVIHY